MSKNASWLFFGDVLWHGWCMESHLFSNERRYWKVQEERLMSFEIGLNWMSLQREKDGFKKLSMSTLNVVSDHADGLVGNLQGPKVFWDSRKTWDHGTQFWIDKRDNIAIHIKEYQNGIDPLVLLFYFLVKCQPTTMSLDNWTCTTYICSSCILRFMCEFWN